MFIKHQQNFLAGAMFMTVGALFALGATKYTIGTAANMGPGYFPLMLGVIMTLLGSVIVLTAILSKSNCSSITEQWPIRPLFCIVCANAAFGILLTGIPSLNIPAGGLIISVYALVLISSSALPDWNIKSSLMLSTILATISYLIFSLALNMQFPVWPAI